MFVKGVGEDSLNKKVLIRKNIVQMNVNFSMAILHVKNVEKNLKKERYRIYYVQIFVKENLEKEKPQNIKNGYCFVR